MNQLQGKILITGGAGTLGKAIIKRAVEEKWDCHITIFSTDAVKHARVRKEYPNVQSVIGDIRQYETLYAAMTGKDLVIHAAAVKEIPTSEYNSIDTIQVNVDGSLNVAMAAAVLHTPDVLAISTDKACHAANAYGASKYMMEKVWQEYSRLGLPTNYHLVRYGNVIESTASVLDAWNRAVEENQPVKITKKEMTRFWLSPSQAVDYVINSLQFPSGYIYIPMMPALSIGKLLEYTVGEYDNIQYIPLRPGEKIHETLLTVDEIPMAHMDWNEGVRESTRGKNPHQYGYDYFILPPTTTEIFPYLVSDKPYTSDTARELSKGELEELLR